MKRQVCRKFATVGTIIVCVAIAILMFPGKAWAATADVPVNYPDLQAALAANQTDIVVSAAGVVACDIPAGVSISFSGSGSIAGDFANYGTVDPGKCSGTIYDYTNTLTGANVRVQGSSLSGVTKVYYSDGVSETAVYRGGVIWIPAGKSVALVVINDYICTPSGGKIQYTVTYLYADSRNSTMKNLNSKNYPATRYLMESGGITIPEAPDKEVDYVFKGWYCEGLGYIDSDNLPKTVAIDGNFAGNLTLISNWTYVNGHNEGLSGGSTALAGSTGSTTGRGGGSGAMGAITASEDDKDEDDDTAEAATINNVLTGQGSGMRVRNAKSTSRHAFSDTDVDVEARAAQRKQSRFPWQWVGVGAAAALLLLAAGITLHRKRMERNEATLEKLNIHD